MIWYVIILAIVMFVAYATKQSRITATSNKGYEHIISISNAGFILVLLILICFEGFRSSTVGTDTGGYCRGFMRHSSIWWRLDLSDPNVIFQEPGLRIVSIIADFFSSNYISFLTVSATVMVTSSLIAIRKSSTNFRASLFVYITLAFYLFGFAGIRQGIAMSIFFLSYQYIDNKQLVKYILVVLIAAMFHKSVLIALPAYFVVQMDFNYKNVFKIILGAVCVGLLMSTLLQWGSSLEDRYEYYSQPTAKGSGSLLALFSVCLTIFYFIQRAKIDEARLPIYDKSLIMLLISSSIYMVVTVTGSNTELNRFAFYFQSGAIFLFAEYVNACKRLGELQILRIASAVHIAYFIAYVNLIGGITNYTLNPILN